MIDPTTTSSFDKVGKFEYNEGITMIQAPGERNNPHELLQKAIVFFPSDKKNASSPSELSTLYEKFPLVVVIHGNHSSLHGYKGYNYLLEHLAYNGIISASIHLYPGAAGVSRARALFKHLEILKSKFQNRIDLSKIGLMGHSRGGEAVVIAPILNINENLGYNFRAAISLAPTDQYGPYSLSKQYQVPYLGIYGSLDGDVVGHRPKTTGFSLYDRVDPLKSFMFVERASHDRFNTEWGDLDLSFGTLTDEEQSIVISFDAHMKIVKGYMNAFFLWHLYGKYDMTKYFTGESIPDEIKKADEGTIVIHTQYDDTSRVLIDKFNNNDWKITDLNGQVSYQHLLNDPKEGDLSQLDTYSPHDTSGMIIQWETNNGRYVSKISSNDSNIHNFNYLSFRVAQKHNSNLNSQNNKDFSIKLTDENGISVSVKVGDYGNIPYPYIRQIDSEQTRFKLTKSTLKTIRIPLKAFSNLDPTIDFTKVMEISFEFNFDISGELEITDLEFTN